GPAQRRAPPRSPPQPPAPRHAHQDRRPGPHHPHHRTRLDDRSQEGDEDRKQRILRRQVSRTVDQRPHATAPSPLPTPTESLLGSCREYACFQCWMEELPGSSRNITVPCSVSPGASTRSPWPGTSMRLIASVMWLTGSTQK